MPRLMSRRVDGVEESLRASWSPRRRLRETASHRRRRRGRARGPRASRERCRDTQGLLGWVAGRGCERAKENAEEGVREKRQELTDAQQLQKEHEDALETSGDDQVKALEDAISRGNDEIKECRDSTKEAMKALATQEKSVKAAQRLEKQQKDLLAGPSAASRCTPSTRIVSRNDGSGWFLFRFRGRSDRV